MRFSLRTSQRAQIAAIGTVALLVTMQSPLTANATTMIQLSSDPYTNSTSMHKTQVEPSIYAYGKTIVAAFQSGRFNNGGSSDLGWAASKDGGTTWTKGFLPGTTIFAGGSAGRISDPSVAYDAKHQTWLIGSLPLGTGPAPSGIGVWVSRSTDNGTTWGSPVTVATQAGTDKDWVTCDNYPTSPYFGHCYVEWDLNSAGNLLYMSTSTDGGATWGAPKNTADHGFGFAAQPVVQPNGTVIVPGDTANANGAQAFSSKDGGTSWSKLTLISPMQSNSPAGGLRAIPIIAAATDRTGKVYVVWSDCRFETSCAVGNDIVMSTSTDGTTWSKVTMIPIDAPNTGMDHFIPGLGIDQSKLTPVHMALAFYYYPKANCTTATCQLDAGFVASADGGNTWSKKVQMAGPMNLSWLPQTTSGYMVGDYIQTTYSLNKAWPVFAIANANSGSTYDESIYTATK